MSSADPFPLPRLACPILHTTPTLPAQRLARCVARWKLFPPRLDTGRSSTSRAARAARSRLGDSPIAVQSSARPSEQSSARNGASSDVHEAKRRAGESERVNWLTNHDARALSCSRDS